MPISNLQNPVLLDHTHLIGPLSNPHFLENLKQILDATAFSHKYHSMYF